jgi:hypothetical protein
MIHRQLLVIALIVLGLLTVYPQIALADFSRCSDFALDADFSCQIPEPSTLTLISSGAAVLASISWWRRRK